MSNRNLVITVVVIVLVIVGVWVGSRVFNRSEVKDSAEQTDQAGQTAPVNQPNSQEKTSMNECKRNFDQAKLKDTVNLKNQFVSLEVKDFGTIKVQLFDQDTPKTVENFLKLTHAGFYDCLTFHRVAKGFVIQGGDPDGDGSGGITASGQPLLDELNPNTASYKTGYVKGVLAMAKTSAPNSGSSQFFITLADVNSTLPKDYTIFGKVVEGQDVVDKIGQVSINPGPFGGTDGTPKVPIVITKASIVK